MLSIIQMDNYFEEDNTAVLIINNTQDTNKLQCHLKDFYGLLDKYFLEEHMKVKEHLRDFYLDYRKIVSAFQVRLKF